VSFAWTPDRCETLDNGSIRCVTPDGVFKVENRPLSAQPGRVRFLLNFKRQDIQGPIAPSLMVRIIDSPPVPTRGIDRLGGITDCDLDPHEVSCVAS